MKIIAAPATLLVLLVSLAQAQNPQPYCTAGASTNGCTPSINANVQPNTANNAGCVITTTGVEGQKQGLVFYGVNNTGFTPTPWGVGGTSFLCVKPPTTRLGAPTNSGGTFGQCDGSYVINWDAFQLANPSALGNPWALGDKVFVQSWYRDPAAVKTSNLSNAVELTLGSSPPAPCATNLPGMASIPPGSFAMGSNAPQGGPYFGHVDERPVHTVTISYCFWLGATEVTQAQYLALMGVNPSQFVGANRPVERVSWFDAQAYCAALTAQQSALGLVPSGYHYRLPTEAEWEYACRAGTTSEFNVGDELYCHQAAMSYSFHSSSSCAQTSTVPVASYPANAWGLHDMHGNLLEWCLDTWETYPQGSVVDPFSSSGLYRILRGGAWEGHSSGARSANRATHFPTDGLASIGFRVALAPVLVP